MEKDLGYSLFDIINKRYKLTEQGKKFYLEKAKTSVNAFRNAFGKEPEHIVKPKMLGKTKEAIARVIKKFRSFVWIKKIAIRIRYIVAFALFFFILTFCNILFNNNYFFDKKIYNMANPLLKELIKQELYKTTDDDIVQLVGLKRIVTGLDLLALNLFKARYEIKVTTITILDNPPT